MGEYLTRGEIVTELLGRKPSSKAALQAVWLIDSLERKVRSMERILSDTDNDNKHLRWQAEFMLELINRERIGE